jgi:hypothetical protein
VVLGSRVRFVKLAAAALVGLGWLSPWHAPARPFAPLAEPAGASSVAPVSARPADVWKALAHCESSGNGRAVGGGGRYFGAFQFDLPTWASVGMAGNPADHPYGVQLAAARRLQAARGWEPWPVCARTLGLLP